VAVTGGVAPYTWAVAAGQLPPGLTLQTFGEPTDADNELAGTPATADTFSFPVQVQDSQDNTATGTVTFTIDP
jgi:hypothetical protein